VTEGVWVKLRCNKLIPATRYLMQIVCTPAQAARSLRTIGAGDRMRMGSPVFRSRVWRALPSNAGETMSGRSGCTGRQLPRRQQGEDEAVPHGWQADANPPSPARLNESPVHGARLSSPIPTRRTTGTEANLAPCRSHSRHAAPKANPEANGRPAFWHAPGHPQRPEKPKGSTAPPADPFRLALEARQISLFQPDRACGG
jgi:hypothetical protein